MPTSDHEFEFISAPRHPARRLKPAERTTVVISRQVHRRIIAFLGEYDKRGSVQGFVETALESYFNALPQSHPQEAA